MNDRPTINRVKLREARKWFAKSIATGQGVPLTTVELRVALAALDALAAIRPATDRDLRDRYPTKGVHGGAPQADRQHGWRDCEQHTIATLRKHGIDLENEAGE